MDATVTDARRAAEPVYKSKPFGPVQISQKFR